MEGAERMGEVRVGKFNVLWQLVW